MRIVKLAVPAVIVSIIVATVANANYRMAPSAPAVTATPIKHLVVIFDENISFDHYFATYPDATNPEGEPAFHAAAGTPQVNGLRGDLLTHNPNLNPDNGDGATNPFRLDRTQAATADQNHAYTPEQRAYHGGALDLFPKFTGEVGKGGSGAFNTKGLVMGYFDGNTVTALWNYAQHFAMSDNAYGDQFGPSTPGAINVVSGQTNGLTIDVGTKRSYATPDGQGGLTMTGDVDPTGDVCSSATAQASLGGQNIGHLLLAAHLTWGWFEGGFDLTITNPNGTVGCKRSTRSDAYGKNIGDYTPHHEPFQYYKATANLDHHRPSSIHAIGSDADGANHQYDVHDFFDAVRSGNFPAVSFLKPPAFQNAHAGNSDPLDEQRFIVDVINMIQQQPDWRSTAIIIAYDDSDGWYDHQMATLRNGSFDSTADQLSGAGRCGTRDSIAQLTGIAGTGPVNGRCGPGARQPFLVISPYAKTNYVDHTQITQSSVIRFIEDNWLKGARLGGGSFDATAGSINGLFDFKRVPRVAPLLLDPETGTVVRRTLK